MQFVGGASFIEVFGHHLDETEVCVDGVGDLVIGVVHEIKPPPSAEPTIICESQR